MAAVYSPKDYDLTATLGELVGIVEKAAEGAAPTPAGSVSVWNLTWLESTKWTGMSAIRPKAVISLDRA